jgi:hypothetical protein
MVLKDLDPNSSSNIVNVARYMVMEIQYIVSSPTAQHNKAKSSQKLPKDL